MVVGTYGLSQRRGHSRQLSLLCRALSEKSHRIVIYTLDAGENANENAHGSVTVRRYHPLFRTAMGGFSVGLLRDLLHDKPDLYHAHGYRDALTDTAALASLLTHRPLVLSAHGAAIGYRYDNPSAANSFLHLLYDKVTFKFAMRKAIAVIATTKGEGQQIVKSGFSQRVAVIPNGIDHRPQVREARTVKTSPRFRLLTVSRVSTIRNFEFLLGMMSVLSAKRRDTRLYVVGGAAQHSHILARKRYYDQILQLKSDLGLSNQIQFLGEVSEGDMASLYESADVFVWTSRYDNFGYPLLDAASYGLPIVSTRVGIAPELIGKNEGGFLVDHNDCAAMAKCVNGLLEDDEKYLAASTYVKRASSRFSVDRMACDYEELYKRILC